MSDKKWPSKKTSEHSAWRICQRLHGVVDDVQLLFRLRHRVWVHREASLRVLALRRPLERLCVLGRRAADALAYARGALAPGVVSVNSAISACERSGEWEQALRLLETLSAAIQKAGVI